VDAAYSSWNLGRPRRILFVCLVASVALHALVFVLFPKLEIDRSAPSVQVLEVRLLAPEPLAVAPVASAPSATGRSRGAQRADAVAASRAPATPSPAPNHGGDQAMAQIGADSSAPAADVPLADKAVKPNPMTAASATWRESLPASRAAYLHNPAPAYPPIARRNGEQGTVTLRVLVARDGAPARVSVERSSGYAHLDRSALEAVREWRFVPAREQGEPVEVWMLVPIAFRLQSAS